MSGCEGLGWLISQTVSRSVGQIVIETRRTDCHRQTGSHVPLHRVFSERVNMFAALTLSSLTVFLISNSNQPRQVRITNIYLK